MNKEKQNKVASQLNCDNKEILIDLLSSFLFLFYAIVHFKKKKSYPIDNYVWSESIE